MRIRAQAHVAESLIEAAQLRLRPILMTTVATVAGLGPITLGMGAGAEVQRSLAIAVTGGLLLSTLPRCSCCRLWSPSPRERGYP